MLEAFVNSNEFKLPDSIKLLSGVLYSWMVELHLDTDKVYISSASFQLASDSVQKEMDSLRPSKTASFSEILIYAKFLQQKGFAVDSKNYWEKLSKQRPDSAELQKLSR